MSVKLLSQNWQVNLHINPVFIVLLFTQVQIQDHNLIMLELVLGFLLYIVIATTLLFTSSNFKCFVRFISLKILPNDFSVLYRKGLTTVDSQSVDYKYNLSVKEKIYLWILITEYHFSKLS